MKNKLVIFFFMVFTVILKSQTCDVYITGIRTSTGELLAGQAVDVRFGIKNDAKGIKCQYPAKSVQVYLYFPESGLIYDKISYPAGGTGEYFEWTFDSSSNAVIGINHKPIGDGEGESEISVRLVAQDVISKDIVRTIGLSIVQHEEGAVFPANNHANDNQLINVNLRTSSKPNLPKLLVLNNQCESMEVFIQGSPSEGIQSWIVERSDNGLDFQKVNAKSLIQGSRDVTWNFFDKNGLKKNQLYTYRLLEIGIDGTENLLAVSEVLNNCLGQTYDFQIFPNPALDKIRIYLGGELQKEVVQLDFRNASGELIKSYFDVSISNNVIELTGLPSGLYYVSIEGNEKISSKKFIRLEH